MPGGEIRNTNLATMLFPGSAGVPPARLVTNDGSTRRRDASAPRAGNPVQFRKTKLVLAAKCAWGNDFTANSGRATGSKPARDRERWFEKKQLLLYLRQFAPLVVRQNFFQKAFFAFVRGGLDRFLFAGNGFRFFPQLELDAGQSIEDGR